ncbi:MAG: alpha-ketoacid dehydrogenase subunit beta [Planctomycetota bacterium]|jgi:2-oxoisovalerate dehydrogenase E1 component beta subunit
MTETITYLDAIRRALVRALENDPRVFLLGEDVGPYGGAFKLTEGLVERFGEDRIIDTPIVETGLVGAAAGAAMAGMRPVVEMQFIDFISCAFNQLTNFVPTTHFRWGAACPLVVRGPSGGGVHAGPFHSQMVESFFLNTPGLKIFVPATVEDAYRGLLGAIEDPDPVLFLEQKRLYRTLKGEFDPGWDPLPLGSAAWRRSGDDVTVITYGAMLGHVLAAAERAAEEGVETAVLDIRCLQPLDREAILEGAARTGKVLIVHEDNITGGAGGELSALIAEHAFDDLDAPIRRMGALDVPIPYAASLEDHSLPNPTTIGEAILELADY